MLLKSRFIISLEYHIFVGSDVQILVMVKSFIISITP